MNGPCHKCPARVLWVALDGGRRMPVDPDVDPAGTVAVMRDARGVLVGRVVSREFPAMPYERLHVTHFATCQPVIDQRAARRAALDDGSVIDLAARRRQRPNSRSTP